MELAAIIISGAALLLTILGIAYVHGKIEARIEQQIKVLDTNYASLVHSVTRTEGRIIEIERRQIQIYRLIAGKPPGESNG